VGGLGVPPLGPLFFPKAPDLGRVAEAPMTRKVVVVILAAGEGKRMRAPVPKVLLDLLGRSVLGHVVDAARTLRPNRIVIVGGRALPLLRAAFGGEEDLEFVRQVRPLGTAHAVVSALPRLPKRGADVLILNGDCPLVRGRSLRALLTRHRRRGAELSLATATVPEPEGLGRILRGPGGGLLRIVEERDATEEERLVQEINAGQYVVGVEALRRMLPGIGRANAQGEFYLTDLVPLARPPVLAIPFSDPDEARGLNRPEELDQARRILRRRILEEHRARGVQFDDPDLVHVETGVRIGKGSRIRPFVVLGRGVTIAARCEVGPFCHLRDGASLGPGTQAGNFVEVKSSALGAGTRVAHLSYLGDALIGRGVNVGAGTITANFDGRRKWTTRIGDEASIGSGTIFVAPVQVGRGARTGAGAVVLRGRDVPAGTTVAGVPARALAAGRRRKG
jgi:bifunctional UDP-N-acetylglucosamine pyrophosphorylase/glucosamine-1-phosphate N-acetyltransferase